MFFDENPTKVQWFKKGKVKRMVQHLSNFPHKDIRKQQKYDEYVAEMTAAERNDLPDESFGLPEKRKYPLDSRKHVLSAIRFFNYCSAKEEKELAENILEAIDRFQMKDVNVGKGNRFYKYYENSYVTEGKLVDTPARYS